MCKGETFFDRKGKVSFALSGSLAWDYYRAVRLIHDYVDSFLTFDKNRLDISRENDYASSTAQVEPWFLWYCFALYETNCYDGDRCDMDVEREYLCLRLFSGEELEKARANAPASLKEQRGCQPYLIQSFCERIPERIPSGIPGAPALPIGSTCIWSTPTTTPIIFASMFIASEPRRVVCRILTTTACNARCAYCYEKGVPVLRMAEETAEQAARFLAWQAKKAEVPVILEWFGGEPTLHLSPVDRICACLGGAGVEYRSSIVTNGLLANRCLAGDRSRLWNLKSAGLPWTAPLAFTRR